MKNVITILGLPLISFALFACSQSANLSTTEGSSAATVDNPSGLTSGEVVTSAYTEVGTVLGTITGSAVTLSLPATATGSTVATFKPTLAMDLAETGNIAGDLETDVLNGAVAYNDAQAALTGVQQAMGGHGLSLKNAGTYAQAASSAVNSSGLTNALATVGADITQQLSQGASLAQVSANVTTAQTTVTP